MATTVLVEVRDVSLADAASVVVAKQRLNAVKITSSGKIHFQLQVPEVDGKSKFSATGTYQPGWQRTDQTR